MFLWSKRITKSLAIWKYKRLSAKDKNPPTNGAIWKNVKKHEREGTSLNINKGRTGKRRGVRTEETIEVVRLYVESNATKVSCRRNRLELRRSTFNKIMKQDLTPRSLTYPAIFILLPGSYLGPCKASKMEIFLRKQLATVSP